MHAKYSESFTNGLTCVIDYYYTKYKCNDVLKKIIIVSCQCLRTVTNLSRLINERTRA